MRPELTSADARELLPLVRAIETQVRRHPASRVLSEQALGDLVAAAAVGAVAYFGPLLREAVEAPSAGYPVPRPVADPVVTPVVCPGCGESARYGRMGRSQIHLAGCSYKTEMEERTP